MFTSIEIYLDALKESMKGADPALVQDAMADAREHLSFALEAAREKSPDLSEADALKSIVEEYGSPDETASAYREIERRTSPSLKRTKGSGSFLGRIFGVYADPRTWGSVLFMLISLVTGVIYFTWAVTGLSLSLGLFVLIIGIPFAILFLFSLHGLALLEGRLVEALLGERMPRRPPFAQPGLKWSERLKALMTDKHTWLSMLYMVLQLPLGIIYFTLDVTLLSVSLACIAAPIGKLLLHNSYIVLDLGTTVAPDWALYLLPVIGLILLTLTMHMTRAIGWLHGKYAKWMLVS